MASPKNWSRDQRKESKSKPFVWRHKMKPISISIQKESVGTMSGGNKMKWVAKLTDRTRSANNQFKVISADTNKEEVREEAVEWMRNHPNG